MDGTKRKPQASGPLKSRVQMICRQANRQPSSMKLTKRPFETLAAVIRSTRWFAKLRLVQVAALLLIGIHPAAADPRAVLELFTSQGCSSCPPADRLLQKLEDQKDILALSLPIDYWDYLGWKDTMASRANSNRQRAYSVRRGDRSVYTPQMIVNGGEHVVGSDAKAISDALKRADPLTTHVALTMNDMALEIRIDGTLPENTKMATVFFGVVDPLVEVPITRGENAGETITYVNVVHQLQPLGMWSGGSGVFRMPKSEILQTGMHKCVVLVQLEATSGPGQIIGAASLNWAKEG